MSTNVKQEPLRVAETTALPPAFAVHELALRYPGHWFAPLEQAPRAGEIEEETIAWMTDLGLLPTVEQVATVRAMRPGIT